MSFRRESLLSLSIETVERKSHDGLHFQTIRLPDEAKSLVFSA